MGITSIKFLSARPMITDQGHRAFEYRFSSDKGDIFCQWPAKMFTGEALAQRLHIEKEHPVVKHLWDDAEREYKRRYDADYGVDITSNIKFRAGFENINGASFNGGPEATKVRIRGEFPQEPVSVDLTLVERGNRYGDFTHHAELTQDIKACMQGMPNWPKLSPAHREALEMIAHKMGRILNGDPNYKDSWHDICGYAKLAEERCED